MPTLNSLHLDAQLEIFSYLKFDDILNYYLSLEEKGEDLFWQDLIKKKYYLVIQNATSDDYKYLERSPNFFRNKTECKEDLCKSFQDYLYKKEMTSTNTHIYWLPKNKFRSKIFRAKTLEGAIYNMLITHKFKDYSTLISYLQLGLASKDTLQSTLADSWYFAKHDAVDSSIRERLIDGVIAPYITQSRTNSLDILRIITKMFKALIVPSAAYEVVEFPEEK